MNQILSKLILVVFVIVLLGGCSTIPRDIEDGPESSPTVIAVQSDPDSLAGSRVRWGGSIVETNNVDGMTRIELVSRPLLSNARPSVNDRTDGRFIAELNGFFDPQIYTSDRMLTVVGTIDSVEKSSVGGQEYNFPVVNVESHYLWEKYTPTDYPYPYGVYDPWGPWPYPYYRRGYYGRYYSPFWPHYRPPHHRH